MIEPRTHFDQVSLTVVKKIVEEQIRQETPIELHPDTKKMLLEVDLLERPKLALARPREIHYVEVKKLS